MSAIPPTSQLTVADLSIDVVPALNDLASLNQRAGSEILSRIACHVNKVHGGFDECLATRKCGDQMRIVRLLI